MTTITNIFNTFAPEYLQRYPHLPISHHKAISAIQNCRTGQYGHSLSRCHSCGEHHRVTHACGHRHCPQCQHHNTQPWLHHRLEKQLPGPHVLLTCTVPDTLRPFIRSHQPIASQTLFYASSQALTRLAQDARFLGTHLPGVPGILHTWGRQLQYHPHIHDIVPGGGLSKDRSPWLPSRANSLVPVQALSPLYGTIYKQEIAKAGILDRLHPQVWTIPGNVHSQANPHGHTSCTYLAPSVFKVAISTSRIVSLQDRTVTFTSRKPGSARQHTANLDAIECIRRFLQHVLPDGCMKVRHFGFMHPSCASKTDPMRLMIVQRLPIGCKTPHVADPVPAVASCPPGGTPMQLVLRLWHSHSSLLDTGCVEGFSEDDRGATRIVSRRATRASSARHQPAKARA
jgi:hypothetical protein